MQSFEIQIVENKYTVEPQENGTFRILDGEEKLGVIYPEPGDDGVEWRTMDGIDPDFVNQLGELISEHSL
ncbi:hypothetical protein [Pedobacter frigiditerrae]|uniref:hypothetical protein n=1 Tax=Pedobacter frigiditerrae TaxID=2530452 RepID=UPI00292EA61B|nr:hypothetical protein [Pedobacter frigiditerrae]